MGIRRPQHLHRFRALLGAALCALLALPAWGRPAARADSWPWLDRGQPLETRVEQLLAELTLREKTRLMYGVEPPASQPAVGYVPGIPRLDVPALVLSDGPNGLRDAGPGSGRPATALPASVSLAASFDPSLAAGYGAILGREARSRGVDVLYGPAMNIVRVPVGGRNFEYFSEDPVLTAALAVPYVRGVQSNGVAAQAKHFALNNQENGRHHLSSNTDERTRYEIYLKAWRAVVQQGQVWSVMCANNPVVGVYPCQNPDLLRTALANRFGFDGVVGSDYAATHSAVESVRAGLDESFTMRDWGAYYRQLPELVSSGRLSVAEIDARVRRVLRMMFRIGLFDGRRDRPPVPVAAHGAFARRAAAQGTVLLRNEGHLLPLSRSTPSIAVIGPYAARAVTGGGGSSRVTPYYAVSPYQGIRARAGSARVVTDDGSNLRRAAATAAGASVAVVVVGDLSREGEDRASIDLPGTQNPLIAAVAAANRRTVVVLDTGAPVTMPWLDRVPAVLEAWYPGQENGNALADVRFGAVNPSGRLPVTFPRTAAQSPSMGAPRYPAGPRGYEYTERLNVGYRGFDALGRTPLFPFGHGLSYTRFAFSALSVSPGTTSGTVPVQVAVTVRNSGDRAGVAVPQVYVGFPPAAGEPPRQLAAFGRVPLAPGETRRVTVVLPPSTFSIWDTARHDYRVANGAYSVKVGASSRDLPLSGTLIIGGAGPEAKALPTTSRRAP